MIRIYHLPLTRSHRVIWLAEELNLCERLAPHSGYGSLDAYWQRLQDRSAYQRAFADYPHP